MAVLAYLGRDNPSLIYPQVLYLFVLFMALNLLAGVSLRRRPDSPLISTAFILANCGTITAILAYSGGAASNLWILFLMPIFTVCLLLDVRETALVAGGVVALNAALILAESAVWGAIVAFEILLKSGFFLFTALVASRLVARDRRAQTRLAAASERAEQLTTRLESASALSNVALVSAGVAHDLRNAFTVILGFSDTLLNDGSLTPDVRDGLERVRRMAKIGGEMSFELARQGSDPAFALAPEDLGTLASGVASLVQNSFLKKSVRLKLAVSEKQLRVGASRVHLQRLFMNLLLNALSVSKPRGEVRLTLTRDGNAAVATLDDDGPGFPTELLPRLFGAYETTRASSGGTGLGLNLCARIAGQHGGALKAENRPGGGARMILVLPLAEKER